MAGVVAMPLAAQQQQSAGSSIPLARSWNIVSQGKAASSGTLLFRVTPSNGEDPVEVSVFVLSGTNETGVASSIRRALSTQLNTSRYDVESGQGASVLLMAEDSVVAGETPGFGLELVDTDVDDVRVMVQNATPVAPPTVPAQNVPANAPNAPVPGSPEDPSASGDASPRQDEQAPENSPVPATSAPRMPNRPPSKTTPPNADGGAGAPASAPPPSSSR
jgi:hypothetical protein